MLSPDVWVELFNQVPRSISFLAASGREATCYPGLTWVLEDSPYTHWSIDTNLMRDPQKWLTEALVDRMRHINVSLHFHPKHERAEQFWQHMSWLADQVPTGSINMQIVISQRELPEEVELAREMAADIDESINVCALTFDQRYMFREIEPVRPGSVSACNGGNKLIVLMPDGTMYRCIGHAYFGRHSMGNVVKSGWEILNEEALPCHHLLCTTCDTVTSDIDEEEQPDVNDFWMGNRLLRSTYGGD
jgi:hypothetical protein